MNKPTNTDKKAPIKSRVQCWLENSSELICVGQFNMIILQLVCKDIHTFNPCIKWELKQGVLDSYLLNRHLQNYKFLITGLVYLESIQEHYEKSATTEYFELTDCVPDYLYPVNTNSNGKSLVTTWTGTANSQMIKHVYENN